MYIRMGKRALDILVALFSCILLSPVLLIIGIMIKVFDPGPIIFRQKRIGRSNQTFMFFKFRSMPVNTNEVASDALAAAKLTWIGKFIRRTNLDEIPQLINILRGEMSIVGPRPPLPSQAALIDARIKNGAMALRPGLTGLAQINSFDGMSVEQKSDWDGIYAKEISLLTDIRILFGTLGYLFKPPPVY